jgi:hypothetical protein
MPGMDICTRARGGVCVCVCVLRGGWWLDACTTPPGLNGRVALPHASQQHNNPTQQQTHRGAGAHAEEQGVGLVAKLLAHLLLHLRHSRFDLVHETGGQVAA